MMRFPNYKQHDLKDCGPTCLKIIGKYYGKSLSIEKLKQHCETTRIGSNLKNISSAAEKIGFRTLGVKISFEKLKEEAPLPAIVFWTQHHFVVVYKIHTKKTPLKRGQTKVYVSDPSHGLLEYTKEEFIKNWIGDSANETTQEGIVLLLEPTPNLIQAQDDIEVDKPIGFNFLFQYLFRYKKFLAQLIIGLLAGSLLSLLFPFLTQSVVDIGIQNQNINFVYLVLAAQIFLFFGKTGLEIIRGWILLHLSTRINISLVSDFFIKLMNLPISFFDTKMTGDIMQRLNDHKRIENLLTTTSLNVLFSLVNLAIFGGVLFWYSPLIFVVFTIGSGIYFSWVMLFLKKRKELDYKRFSQMSQEQSKVIELINGMQEIKLHNAEKQKRWSWEYLRARLFRIEIKSLVLEQSQTVGSNFVHEIKNIFITVFAAKLVIEGQLTLGMMLSISYILGQLNAPIMQLVGFLHSVQDAKIGLERLSEIHNKKDEENVNDEKVTDLRFTSSFYNDLQNAGANGIFDGSGDISLTNVSFRYTGSAESVINDLSLTIPSNKVTAIVGASGSGKTTLMKMLLKFYEPDNGEIKFGNINLNSIAQKTWREVCGVVMQEGYIFNATIANNIAIGEESIDKEKLATAVDMASIKEFIEGLPLAYNTKIGLEGIGMSTGQKQRLLIARAIYKNPKIIFFDEATSSLDAKNERVIMENLNFFMKGKTAVVIAHRLSTVKNADQIVVLGKGKIIEKGTHNELIALEGSYYNLVKDQLDLEKINA